MEACLTRRQFILHRDTDHKTVIGQDRYITTVLG